jgi:hypothetical protein
MYSGLEGTWAAGRLVSKACYADAVVRSLLKKMGTEEKEQVADPQDDGSQDDDAQDAEETSDADPAATEGVLEVGPEIKELEEIVKTEQLEQLGAVMTHQSESLPAVIERMNRFTDAHYEY